MMSPTRASAEPVLTPAAHNNGITTTATTTPSFVLSTTDGTTIIHNNNNNNNGTTNSDLHHQQSKSQCSSLSDAENYEWSGEAEVDQDHQGHNVINSSIISNEARSPVSINNRNTWLRTSLRRSSPNHQESLSNRRWGSFRHNGKRQQLGSNALASQLYRSSSFNSSGRSSTCDTTDDMYSDASLEEDVHDLHHKFQILQQQVGVLQDSANQNDERYTRAKADNATLQTRVMMLEEQLRETEIRYEEKLQDEQRRMKELISRLEREKQLQLENASIRLHASETECASLKEEIARQRMHLEKYENQRQNLLDQVQDLTNELNSMKEEEKILKEKEHKMKRDHEAQVNLLEELSREVERLRIEARTPALPTTSPEMLRLEELHEEMSAVRSENAQLKEVNEELQASLLHAGLETGRILTIGENSLAAELDIMSQDEVQKALKEQQEVNRQLRTYIEGILLNIVENHPQLLEVKHRGAT